MSVSEFNGPVEILLSAGLFYIDVAVTDNWGAVTEYTIQDGMKTVLMTN